MYAVRLHTSIRDLPPRGGAAIVEADGKVIIFGGADREQVSYQDIAVLKDARAPSGSSSIFSVLSEPQGDIPMPRSGHAIASYGRFVFLYGGIDFGEESVFNDLYILDTENFEWHYVGESGAEIPARNSHSLAILQVEGSQAGVLVVFGGASPENGTFGDCYYAILPSPDAIDLTTFHVKWIKVTAEGPCAREMHGCAALRDRMYVSGGRKESGDLLSDLWALKLSSISDETAVIEWESFPHAPLPEGRCAHTASFLTKAGHASPTLVLYGGINQAGIAHEFLSISSAVLTSRDTSGSWTASVISNVSIPSRFGHSMCSISDHLTQTLSSHHLYGSVMKREGITVEPNTTALLMFGGVNAEQDLGDVWMFLLA